jgi:hypothetical protein
LTGTLSPPFLRLERHVPDEREALGGRNASPELAIEGPVAAVQRHDTAGSEAPLLATIHLRSLYCRARWQASRADPSGIRGKWEDQPADVHRLVARAGHKVEVQVVA